MTAVDIIFRWLHILPAIALVGGAIFMRLAYVPGLRASGQPQDELREAVRSRWAKVVMASVALLLLSGLYNTAMLSMTYTLGGLYMGLLSVKMLLALVIFYLASVLSGRSATAQKIRQSETLWLNVAVVLMVILVCIAGIMKVLPKTLKVKGDDNSPVSALVEPLDRATGS